MDATQSTSRTDDLDLPWAGGVVSIIRGSSTVRLNGDPTPEPAHKARHWALCIAAAVLYAAGEHSSRSDLPSPDQVLLDPIGQSLALWEDGEIAASPGVVEIDGDVLTVDEAAQFSACLERAAAASEIAA